MAGSRKQILQLDGVRAVAFVAVLLSHAGYPGYLFWSSVDLFFVLSGFLITGILLSQKKDENFFKIFYTRRFLRILPAFYAVLFISLFVLQRVSKDQTISVALFLANIYMPFADLSKVTDSYWALGPYWSLALEEQFYLLWPLLVYTLKPRQLLWLCISLIIAAPICRGLSFWFLYVPHLANYQAIWMFPFNRMDLLASGAIIAICQHLKLFEVRKMARFGMLLAAASAVLVVLGIAIIPSFRLSGHTFLFSTLGFSLVCAMMGGFIMYLANETGGPIVKVLSLKPLAYAGTITYTMYLAHVTVIVLLQRAGMQHSWRVPLVAWAGSFVLASLSWHLFELPIKQLKDRMVWTKGGSGSKPARSWMWPTAVAAAMVAGMVIAVLPRLSSTPQIIPQAVAEAPQAVADLPQADALEMLGDQVPPQFYRDLDFYRWLASQEPHV
ncbi:MAG: acyltransferase family protein [Stenotrophobium sp.]